MRTRNEASERQNENIFTGRLPCGRLGSCVLAGFIAEIVMAASISYCAGDLDAQLVMPGLVPGIHVLLS
jgi:hypothetical protein